MGDVASHLRLWIVASVGLAADLWTKDWAFRTLKPGENMDLVRNLCSLQVSLNPGALFGIGAGLAPIFVGASVLALMFVLYLFAHSTTSRWSMHVALGLVLAGAVGNLYDRTTQSAYVLHFPKGGRLIGTLVEQTDQIVELGDFPTGARAKKYARSTFEAGGVEPVVRDFIKIEAKIGTYSLWPWIFNIADALLVVGVAMLLINFWSDRHGHAKPGQHPEPAA
jgi:lipoprotein signal peptidase